MARGERILLFFDLLARIEQESHCLRNSIGAILTNQQIDRIVAFGYNGNVAGGPNSCDSSEVGKCGCIHAETNALVKPRVEDPYAIFVSETPCLNCAKLVVNAGIREVYASRRYRDSDKSIKLFEDRGILYFEHELQHTHHPGWHPTHLITSGGYMADLTPDVKALRDQALADGESLIKNAAAFLESTITGVTTDVKELAPEALKAAVSYGTSLVSHNATAEAVLAFAQPFIQQAENAVVTPLDAQIAAIDAKLHQFVAAAILRLGGAASASSSQ